MHITRKAIGDMKYIRLFLFNTLLFNTVLFNNILFSAPAFAEETMWRYTVRPGDNLITLGKRHLINADR